MDPKETGITFKATGGGSNVTGANRARIFNLGAFWSFGRTRIRVDVSGECKRGGRGRIGGNEGGLGLYGGLITLAQSLLTRGCLQPLKVAPW